MDNAIHRINHDPLDTAIGFAMTYPLDSDLSSGQRYPSSEQLGLGHNFLSRTITHVFMNCGIVDLWQCNLYSAFLRLSDSFSTLFDNTRGSYHFQM